MSVINKLISLYMLIKFSVILYNRLTFSKYVCHFIHLTFRCLYKSIRCENVTTIVSLQVGLMTVRLMLGNVLANLRLRWTRLPSERA